MRKKLICAGLALAMAVAPLQASAQSLSSTFDTLLGGGAATINAPGSFSSQARSGVTAGGIEVRVPRMTGNTPQLLSVTPPRITAGCQGISAHFGGFSFISGAEFGALLKQIASGAALGFVTSLVMKTLCPPCEAIVQELKTAAAAASKNLKDSCEWGRQQGDKFMAGLTGAPAKEQTCATILADSNSTGDSGSAWSGACNSIASASAAIRQLLPAADPATATGAAQKAANDEVMTCDMGAGNITWARLSAFDMDKSGGAATIENTTRKLLLLNMMGAELGPGGPLDNASCDEDAGTFVMDKSQAATPGKTASTHYCKPPIDSKLLTGLFLCGAPDAAGALVGGSGSTRIKDYCASFFGKDSTAIASTTQVWTCEDGPERCLHLKKVPAGSVLLGEGFMVAVNRLLLDAVARVRNSTGFEDETGRKIVQLIQVAPYPLYQAINAAAVYPAAGTDLMDSMSILVGEQFAYAMIDETLKVTNRKSASNCALSQPQAAKMLEFITAFRNENKSRRELIGQNFAVQQGITRQIHEINLAIQQQTMSEDLMGAGRLSESINSAITPVSKVAP